MNVLSGLFALVAGSFVLYVAAMVLLTAFLSIKGRKAPSKVASKASRSGFERMAWEQVYRLARAAALDQGKRKRA